MWSDRLWQRKTHIFQPDCKTATDRKPVLTDADKGVLLMIAIVVTSTATIAILLIVFAA